MTNLADIYAAGDCCEVFNLVSQDWVYTPLGDIANKQGRVAGQNAAGGKLYSLVWWDLLLSKYLNWR
jgi:NADPH-dependent 2,4-dienoyl-CoA reductase/sulfur reductase-like enzyme